VGVGVRVGVGGDGGAAGARVHIRCAHVVRACGARARNAEERLGTGGMRTSQESSRVLNCLYTPE